MAPALFATARALLFAATVAPAATAPVTTVLQSASSVCVYNEAAVMLRWRLRDVETGRELKQDRAYPVGEVRCLQADGLNAWRLRHKVGSVSKLLPVVKAVWGREFEATEPILYNAANASQITYVCRGVAFDFSCKPEPPPPSAFNVTKDIGKFIGGFIEGLMIEISGFRGCLSNLKKTHKDISSAATFFEHGINNKNTTHVVSAFEIIGKLLLDFGNAIATCVAGAENVVQMLVGLSAWLGGGVLKVIKIVVDERHILKIFHKITDITSDCKTIVSAWKAGDFFSSGNALGDLVGTLAEGLVAEVGQTGNLRLLPPVALQNTLLNASSALVVV